MAESGRKNMTNGEKKYIGNVWRWGLFGLIGMPIIAALIIRALVPDTTQLKYSDGKFHTWQARSEYDRIFGVIFCIAAGLVILSLISEIKARQSFLKTIARFALSLLLGFGVIITIFIGGVMTTGLFEDWNDPYGAKEYDFDGQLIVLCNAPDGMHHSHPELYEIVGDNAYFLGKGDIFDGRRCDEFHVEQNDSCYVVSYTETINGVNKEKQFIAKLRGE
ncbi:MAG: hypothetical protein K6B74_03855 [Ruminococcus sp.]|nr:hypothetical protein [Ruminococcus sp.]